jgi:2-dehydro-3-deoxygluconokinase
LFDVVTIGDALVAMSPTSTGRLRFVQSFEKKVGGAELNVAIGCARLGLKTGWISRLGKDEFGYYIRNFVRGEGVDTSQVQLIDAYPTSLYFKEMFDNGRSKSYYYRQKSPTATMKPDQINESYLKQTKLLHVSGVFPAVYKTNFDVLLHTVKLAKKHELLVTFDPNIRLKLWTSEEARMKLLQLIPFVDVVLTGEEEAKILVGTSEPTQVFQNFKLLGVHHLILKRGERGAIGFYNGETIYSPAFPLERVIDPVGAGDGFAAGYLYGLLNKWDIHDSLRFANAIGSMVVLVKGDNEGLPSMEEVEVYLGKKDWIER